MKKAFLWILTLTMCFCMLGVARSGSVQDRLPPPERSGAPAASAGASSKSQAERPAPRPRPSSAVREPDCRTKADRYSGPPEGWTPPEREPVFPLDKESLDETGRRIGKFLLNIQWGTNVATINGSSKAEFSSAKELDPVLLLECCLMNGETTKEVPGFRKEDVEKRARFYFGDDAAIDHNAIQDERFHLYWEYSEETESYFPSGWDMMSEWQPFLLSYTREGDRYEAFFTSVALSAFAGVQPPDWQEWTVSDEEAESWYREHGSRARAVLREQEDGRFIMESLKVFWTYDPWEETREES